MKNLKHFGVTELQTTEKLEFTAGGFLAKILGVLVGVLSGPNDLYDHNGVKTYATSTGF
ncbi:MAG: hypothetical protein KKC03_02735 [Bacteroidetes bacterium]|nr:hypothetical protein [Bacteroidota bacterium]